MYIQHTIQEVQTQEIAFGVKVSQDIFQCKLDEILRDIPNVAGIADDILVFGSSVKEQNMICTNNIMLGWYMCVVLCLFLDNSDSPSIVEQ